MEECDINISKYKLKNGVNIEGREYEIRTDYSVILDIFEALNDPDLTGQEKTFSILDMFYPAFLPDDESEIPMKPEHYQKAIEECFHFINGTDNEEKSKGGPKLVDWEKDFNIIVGAINRGLGYDIRSAEYDPKTNTGGVSWQTFISAYYEIGDCLFAQIVRIRDMKARGKPLDKQDREWYQKNRHLVDLKTKYTPQDDAVFDKWTGKRNAAP